MPGSLLDPALLERIQGLTLAARRIVEGALHGLHHSPRQGLSIEFVQHRAYSPGDELKRLDWRVLGRSDRYVIKQHQQETNLRAVLIVDGSRSMAYGGEPGPAAPDLRIRRDSAAGSRRGAAGPNGGAAPPDGAPQPAESNVSAAAGPHSKFEYARHLAAALAWLLLQQGDSVGLVLVRDRPVAQVPPRAAPGHISSICRVLAAARPAGRTDLAGALAQTAGRLKRRSLIILISDLLDEPAGVLSALGQVHHRGHEVIVFQVLDRREVDFDLGRAGAGVTVIRDMETGAEFAAEPALIRARVQAEIDDFLARLDAGARRHGIDLERCPTDAPLERLLAGYLAARGRRKNCRAANRAPRSRRPPGRPSP